MSNNVTNSIVKKMYGKYNLNIKQLTYTRFIIDYKPHVITIKHMLNIIKNPMEY